jgi:hypothetical protein
MEFDITKALAVVVGAIGLITPLLQKWSKAPRAVKILAKRISENGVLTHEDIDNAVESILSGGRPPSLFVDLVGDIVADCVTRVPNYLAVPIEQRIGIIAALVSKQTKARIRAAFPLIPESILKQNWALRKFIYSVLTLTGLVVEKEHVNG